MNKITGIVCVVTAYVFVAGVGIVNGADNITHLIIVIVAVVALVIIGSQKENK